MRLFIIVLLALHGIAWAAPKAELWEAWTPYDESSVVTVDHSEWDRILKTYVVADHLSGVNRVLYSRVTDSDRVSLDTYISGLSKMRVAGLSREEQEAYWINAYNALTVKVVLDRWPVASIRDVNLGGGGLLGRGPWDHPLFEAEGRPITLNDIEHRILRPIWKDPRIHYALNCASIGCPNLQPEAYTRDNTDLLLDRSASQFINHPRGVTVDGATLWLSSIYDWFGADFGAGRDELLRHIAGYADRELSKLLEPFLRGQGRIRYGYDWGINSAE